MLYAIHPLDIIHNSVSRDKTNATDDNRQPLATGCFLSEISSTIDLLLRGLHMKII